MINEVLLKLESKAKRAGWEGEEMSKWQNTVFNLPDQTFKTFCWDLS